MKDLIISLDIEYMAYAPEVLSLGLRYICRRAIGPERDADIPDYPAPPALGLSHHPPETDSHTSRTPKGLPVVPPYP